MHSSNSQPTHLSRRNSEPSPRPGSLESTLENGEYRHSADANPKYPPVARRRRSYKKHNGSKANYSAKTAEVTEWNNCAEGMYSSCEDDFSMEEGSMGRKRRFGSSESTRRSPRNMRVHLKTPFTVSNQIRRTVLNSWINILLVCAPIGIVLYYHESVSPAAVFVVNLLAIIPLAGLLSYATEEVALRLGKTLRAILEICFGTAVESIIAVLALVNREILIVKASLIGSMLSNLLLALGVCFFVGGFRRTEQYFNSALAKTRSILLALAAFSLIIPTTFERWTHASGDANSSSTSQISSLSRAAAILLLLVYACYHAFQWKTFAGVYNPQSEKILRKSSKRKSKFDGHSERRDKSDEELDEPELHIWIAIAMLVISITFVVFCTKNTIESIDAITSSGGITKTFIGLILLPIVANATTLVTAATVAIKDKMDLAISIVIATSLELGLFVLPLLVVVGWGLKIDDMTLLFDGFQITILFVTILLLNHLVQDGKSQWLEGAVLIAIYLIVSVAAWFYPS